MFDWLAGRIKARRAEKRYEMTDYNFYENDEDDLVDVPDYVYESAQRAHTTPDPDEDAQPEVVEDDSHETDGEQPSKPGLDQGAVIGPYHSVRTGEAVAYVNNALGLEGDRYTRETVLAVKRYQSENDLRVTGVVNYELYNKL